MSQQFQVDLRAVVELLARHVYSSPRVFVRELIQNGIDAVTAARLLDPAAPMGPIEFLPADAGGDGALVVRDPGIGLTLDEVHELLATIGGSSKRDELDLPREGFLGRFGIGLLSCFVIADQIEVTTRSARGGPPVRFIGRDDGTYEVEELASDDDRAPAAGTVVRLVPRSETRSWVAAATVEALARQFGSELPVPILVHRPDGTAVDVIDPAPAWLVPDLDPASHAAWCQERFGFRPLDVVPVESPSTGARGLAFVLPMEPGGAAGIGHLAYLRRMLLSDDARDLLPDWAFFVRVVLDVGNLQPTASRESLVDDEALDEARDEMGACLRRWLMQLGATDPGRLDHVLRVHGRAAKALAVADDEVYAALGPWFRFETTAGDLTLPELVQRAGTVRYTPSVDRFRLLAPIAAAQGLVIVNAGYTYDVELLDRAHVAVPGAVAEALGDDDIVSTLDAVSADRQAVAARFLGRAAEALSEVGCDVDLRSFEPEVVPSLFLMDEDALDQRRLSTTAEQVDEEWAGLLAGLELDEPDKPRLVFNDRHPLIRRLVDLAATGAPTVGTAAEALYVQALLLGHYPLRASDLAMLNRALLSLVDGALPEEGRS